MIDFLVEYGYWGFLIASFLSATILPFSSELVLSGLLVAGSDPMLCVILGTVGNTLGGLTCYWIGTLGKVEWMEKYLGVSLEKVNQLQEWVEKYGSPIAFLSFLPVVGDAINVALGYLHSNFKWVTFFMALGKFSRYFVWMMMNNFLLDYFAN